MGAPNFEHGARWPVARALVSWGAFLWSEAGFVLVAGILGPHRLAATLGVARSTCYAVLRRHGLQRLDWMDRPTGKVIRRYERARPDELIHIDVKKLGRIPPGGGWHVLGRAPGRHSTGRGYDYVHAALTITAASPIPRSMPRRAPTRVLPSWCAPVSSLPPMARSWSA
jgi:hypothetical protein